MDNRKLVPISEAIEKFKISRTSLDTRCREGSLQKFKFGSKVYLDENEILNSIQPKLKSA